MHNQIENCDHKRNYQGKKNADKKIVMTRQKKKTTARKSHNTTERNTSEYIGERRETLKRMLLGKAMQTK